MGNATKGYHRCYLCDLSIRYLAFVRYYRVDKGWAIGRISVSSLNLSAAKGIITTR